MPYDEPDETDPMLLVGVELPASLDVHQEAASAFADEFARMGFDETRVMALFQNPFYAGAHRAYCALGEAAVRAIVQEQTGFWGRVQFRDREPEPTTPLSTSGENPDPPGIRTPPSGRSSDYGDSL